jgi:hypothetical protein
VVPAVGRHVVQVHVLAGPPPHVGVQVLDHSRPHSILAMLTMLDLVLDLTYKYMSCKENCRKDNFRYCKSKYFAKNKFNNVASG